MPRCLVCNCEITVFENYCRECVDCDACSDPDCSCSCGCGNCPPKEYDEPDVDEQQEMEDFAQDNLLENNYSDE